jgi:pentalenene oxygenase
MVGRALLGVDLTAEAPDVRAGLEAALGRFGGSDTAQFGRLRPAAAPAADGRPEAVVHALVDRVIAERRADRCADRGDVISALLESQELGSLSDVDVHDHVMTLLMAGHETTANALTWTWYLLSGRPHVQRRLAAEAAALPGPRPSYADLPSLPYTRAVISEAMRLYPPAWIIGRTTTAGLRLAGLQVPAGSLVAVSPLLLHHDQRWFADPESFDPDRWLDSRRHEVPRHAYLPFGTGPRACVGEQFAWAEAVTTLSVLAARWTATVDPDHQVRSQYRVTLRPAGGMPMTLRARH